MSAVIDELVNLQTTLRDTEKANRLAKQKIRQLEADLKAKTKQLDFYEKANHRAKTFDAWDEKWCMLRNAEITFKRKPNGRMVKIKIRGKPLVIGEDLKSVIREARKRFGTVK